ncbi:Protein anachronism [Eumeta japonica]|uniref:Protein anachronism n=1 Tax=Eumeta variegata TaxID=151549 RepID=A0A4C1SWZ1_EUMVA|nr:Protein anachronism [Eumeta japonica]
MALMEHSSWAMPAMVSLPRYHGHFCEKVGQYRTNSALISLPSPHTLHLPPSYTVKMCPQLRVACENSRLPYYFTPRKIANTGKSEEIPKLDNDEMPDDDTAKLKRCAQPNMDAQIRVTVSIVQQTRRNKRGVYERKKRICNTVMMNVSQTGWVEIDIKRAIYIWEETAKQLQQTQQNRSPVLVGWLMIEVHDEEQPLKPGLFFKPPNCNQAGINTQNLRQESNLRPRDCWAGVLSTQPSRRSSTK